jgi:hypothetical protein
MGVVDRLPWSSDRTFAMLGAILQTCHDGRTSERKMGQEWFLTSLVESSLPRTADGGRVVGTAGRSGNLTLEKHYESV